MTLINYDAMSLDELRQYVRKQTKLESEQKFSNKEPKYFQKLQLEQTIKVEITEIKEDENIKKIKYLPNSSS